MYRQRNWQRKECESYFAFEYSHVRQIDRRPHLIQTPNTMHVEVPGLGIAAASP